MLWACALRTLLNYPLMDFHLLGNDGVASGYKRKSRRALALTESK